MRSPCLSHEMQEDKPAKALVFNESGNFPMVDGKPMS
jgi:hypothetical protein